MNYKGADITLEVGMKSNRTSAAKSPSFLSTLELVLHKMALRLDAGLSVTDEELEQIAQRVDMSSIPEADPAEVHRILRERLANVRTSELPAEALPLTSLLQTSLKEPPHGTEEPDATEQRDIYLSTLLNLPQYKPGMTLSELLGPGSCRMTALHRAAWVGELKLIPGLCLTGEHLTLRDEYGRTPLHLAAAGGHLSQVPSHVLTLANLTLEDRAGESPLFLAARSGTLEQVLGRSPARRQQTWRGLTRQEQACWRKELDRYEPLPEGVAEIISKPRPRTKTRSKCVPLLVGFKEFCRRLQKKDEGFFTGAQVTRLIKGATYYGIALQAHEIKIGWGISRLGDGANWCLDLRKVYNCLVKAGNIMRPPSARRRLSKEGKKDKSEKERSRELNRIMSAQSRVWGHQFEQHRFEKKRLDQN